MKKYVIKTGRLSSVLFALILLLPAMGCDDDGFNRCIVGNDRVVTDEIIGLPSFTGVSNASAVEVFISRGNFYEVLISGEDNIIDEIDFRVSKGELLIENRRGRCLSPRRPVEIFITLPALESVVLAGSGNMQSDDVFEADRFRTELTGSGNIRLSGIAGTLDALLGGSGNFVLDFEAAEIKLDLIGSGNISLVGAADVLDLLIAGSGNLFGFDCPAEEVYVTVSGSGNCEVLAIDLLEVVISGSGNVWYRGNPDVGVTITGSGSLVNAN